MQKKCHVKPKLSQKNAINSAIKTSAYLSAMEDKRSGKAASRASAGAAQKAALALENLSAKLEDGLKLQNIINGGKSHCGALPPMLVEAATLPAGMLA